MVSCDGNSFRLIEGGTISTSSDMPLDERVAEISNDIAALIAEYNPSGIGVETIFSDSRYPGSALKLAQLRGAILLTLNGCGVTHKSYSPTTVKKSMTGNGHATKEQVQEAVRRTLRHKTVLEPNDIADAAAIAIIHAGCVRRENLEPSEWTVL